MLHPDGSFAWIYPSNGTVPGNLYEVDTLGLGSPIYTITAFYSVLAQPKSVTQLNPDGTANWSNNNAPADMIMPTREGFYSVFAPYENEGFLERFDEHGHAD